MSIILVREIVDVISEHRVRRITLVLAAIGTIAVLAKFGIRDSLGFLPSGLDYPILSFRSWVRLAATIGDSGKRPANRFRQSS